VKLKDLYKYIALVIFTLVAERWEGHVACMGEGAYRVLVGKPEEQRSLGRPMLR
jgi:hypothetical protein